VVVVLAFIPLTLGALPVLTAFSVLSPLTVAVAVVLSQQKTLVVTAVPVVAALFPMPQEEPE
jgi:hypothetical protein